MTPHAAARPLALARYFRRLKDPRVTGRCKHLLLDVVTIALCAVIAGADNPEQVAAFGRTRKDWLKTFLALPNGVPAHDTYERLFAALDPLAFQHCFQRWMQAVCAALNLKQIAIDGKTLRGSGERASGLGPLHLVSAWATENHLSLGQVAVDTKSNEIIAIPELLKLLDLHGALVTIDAMGCQKKIASQIVAGGGDYLFPAKENQPHLLADIQACLQRAFEAGSFKIPGHTFETFEKGHGREERRCYTVLHDPEGIRNKDAWAKLTTIGMCTNIRTVNGETSEEVHYFISSRRLTAQLAGKALRGHWGIENNLHWQLDVTFREDENHVLNRNGAQNMALLRRLAVGLLKGHPSKQSLANKRYQAALDANFLEEILRGGVILGEV
jgi:predicted transposase YbfD/YdcC